MMSLNLEVKQSWITSVPLSKGASMEKDLTKEWVELVPIMLVPCPTCSALWQPDQSCPICDDVDLSNVKEEIQDVRFNER